jgi:hypothetical protein
MIPPMNGLVTYALGDALHRALAGSEITAVTQYAGGVTIALGGAPVSHLHILGHGAGADLVAADAPIVSERQSAAVMQPLSGARITRVEALGVERIILIHAESSAHWGGSRKCIVRLDLTPAMKPLTVFFADRERPAVSLGPRGARTPRRPDETPRAKPVSVLAVPDDPPQALMQGERGVAGAAGEDHTRAWSAVQRTAAGLLHLVGGIDPILAHALSREHGGDPIRLWRTLREIGGALSAGDWRWAVYSFPEAGRAGRHVLYPVRLPVGNVVSSHDDWKTAVGEWASRDALPRYRESLIGSARAAAARELKKAERLLRNLTTDLERAERYKEFRHRGNLLATNRHLLTPGMKELSVRDYSGGRMVKIPLDPRLGPEQNIKRYFTRAKKGEKGLLIIRDRRREIADEIPRLRAKVESISRLTDPDDIIALIPRPQFAAAGTAQRDDPGFRRYRLDGRHTVYVGRNNKENDLLTHRFAGPGDLWFHAQGVAGSHVILKGATRSTPKRILEKAAAVAAHFSKARHSTTVPVVYTEKRYVRKPRRAKPGTAVHERGKTLFVAPALPDERDAAGN